MPEIPQSNVYTRVLEHLRDAAKELEAYVGSKENPGACTEAERNILQHAAPLLVQTALIIFKAAVKGRQIEEKDVPR